jgi:copper resistance protein C
MKRLVSVAILLGSFSLSLVPVPARAHAHLYHAMPAAGSTVTQAPRELRIWFTQKLEPSFSGVEVVDAKGQRVDQGDAKADAADPTILSIALKPLPPGDYKVTWHVVSVDTHATQGDFTFSVKAQGAP